MRALKSYFLVLLIPGLFCSCDAPPQSEPAASVSKKDKQPIPARRIAARVADRLPHTHLNRMPFNDTIATNALMLFIDSFDFDRSYFLARDIEAFQQEATRLDNQVREGDVAFAQTIVDRFHKRVTNRVSFVNELLDDGFDLTVDETYRWKRDESPWPKDETAWDELWRKKIKNEYVGRVAMKELPDEETTPDDEEALDEPEEDEQLEPDEFIRNRYKQFELMVRNNFDNEAVLERYLSAFAQSYDPHSAYLSPRGVEDFDIHMSLSLVGIGAMLRSEDGTAEITKIIPGGPAEADGRLKPGDQIIAIAQGNEDPVNILYWPLSKAVRLIRGEKGTKVVLTIIPAEEKTGTRTKKIALTRDEVKLEEQAASSRVHESIGTNALPHRLGVITLPEFYADFAGARKGKDDVRRCSVDVRNILNQFSTNAVNGVILDLRNDGGGSLTEAIDIAGQFIPLGPIVQVRENRGVAVLPDSDPTTEYSGPLVVLVNRLSASASEIVAAALQDYERAVIVGDNKTHGKGTVQTVKPLSRLTDDLGSLKVTTAGFYRIAGGSTQLRGVTPDITLPSLYDSLEIGEEFLDNALPWSQVKSAYFNPWHNSVKPLLPELKARSTRRMENNPEFSTFLARRERLRERIKTPVVSLKLSSRVDEILAEQELEDLQDSLVATDDNGKKEKDPILDEALRILSDLVELSSDERLAAELKNP